MSQSRPSSIVVDAIRSSKRVTDIHDLPWSILVEILCRLPSYEYIARCKCVSKTWCTLMSDLSFIKHFVCLHSNNGKQPSVVRTLVNDDGWEFLDRISLSHDPLARLFEKLMFVQRLKKLPTVVGTYNDLVLCSSSRDGYDYYICNPQTCQWVTVPHPPKLYSDSLLGFICDRPYFQCMDFNPQYRCRIVRLIIDCNREKKLISEFRVEMFSSETGEWTESTVLIPSPIYSGDLAGVCFPYNGVLYWKGDYQLIGVDPFMITSSNTSDHYKCRLLEFLDPDPRICTQVISEDRGCIQMLCYKIQTHILYVWEVNEDDFFAEAGKYCLQERMRAHELDWKMVDEYGYASYWIFPLGFDPNNDGTLYMHIGPDVTTVEGKGEIIMYNFCTREWSKIVENSSFSGHEFYPLARQCWPTPVPKLPPRCE